MREVVWSSQARSQYLTALAYLTDKNETAAAKLFDRVEATTAGLAKRPIGRPGYAVGTFEKIVQQTSYIVVFELAGDELRVLRLFHMSQDWRGWLDEKTDAQ
ncbi:MAG: type II toxin-antitoxin system RelE/ParE family toxin [Pseudomonadota bacterium]